MQWTITSSPPLKAKCLVSNPQPHEAAQPLWLMCAGCSAPSYMTQWVRLPPPTSVKSQPMQTRYAQKLIWTIKRHIRQSSPHIFKHPWLWWGHKILTMCLGICMHQCHVGMLCVCVSVSLFQIPWAAAADLRWPCRDSTDWSTHSTDPTAGLLWLVIRQLCLRVKQQRQQQQQQQ